MKLVRRALDPLSYYPVIYPAAKMSFLISGAGHSSPYKKTSATPN